MESIPYLVLEKIVQQLSLEDLARCSAVCREWREIFNQDWMWKPHCDPELEEPLRTIPSIVTPAFVTPEEDDSTLVPLCQQRLAYMREKYLWRNWGNQDSKNDCKILDAHSNERNEKGWFIYLDFLTDTLVVVWYSDCIEILDVSVKPPISWAKLHTTVNPSSKLSQCVIRSTMLIVENAFSVDVFDVDMTKKLIHQRHSISIQALVKRHVVKDHCCMFTSEKGSNKFNIYDLDSGKIMKDETFPMVINKSFQFWDTKSSPTSEFIAVAIISNGKPSGPSKFCIYNIKHLSFLPDVVFDLINPMGYVRNEIALHHQYLAFTDSDTGFLAVYDLESKEVLHKEEDVFVDIFVCDNSFVFIAKSSFGTTGNWLKSYSPLHKTFIISSKLLSLPHVIQITRNKLFVSLSDKFCQTNVFKFSGKKLKNDISCHQSVWKVNENCTKSVYIISSYNVEPDDTIYIRYCW